DAEERNVGDQVAVPGLKGDARVDNADAGLSGAVEKPPGHVDDAAPLDLGPEVRGERSVGAHDVVLPVAGDEGRGGGVQFHGGASCSGAGDDGRADVGDVALGGEGVGQEHAERVHSGLQHQLGLLLQLVGRAVQ